MEKQASSGWMSTISNETIVNWYYVLFIVVSVFSAVLVVSILYRYGTMKNGNIVMALLKLVTPAIAVVNALFLYILASRTLR